VCYEDNFQLRKCVKLIIDNAESTKLLSNARKVSLLAIDAMIAHDYMLLQIPIHARQNGNY